MGWEKGDRRVGDRLIGVKEGERWTITKGHWNGVMEPTLYG